MGAHNAYSRVANSPAPTPTGSHAAHPDGAPTDAPGTVEPTGNGKVRTGLNIYGLINDALDASKFQGTLLVVAFVILKVLAVAKADMFTGLAIINASGIISVIVGVALSSLPILAAGLFTIGVYRVAMSELGIRDITWSFVAWGLAILAAVVLLAPWPVVALGFLTFFIGRITRNLKREGWRIRRPLRYVAQVVLILLALSPLVYVAQDALFVMWVPREKLQFNDGKAPFVGYVLEDKEGWMSALKSQERKVFRIESKTVTDRSLCRKNYHESIWQFSNRNIRGIDTRVPDCDDTETLTLE